MKTNDLSAGVKRRLVSRNWQMCYCGWHVYLVGNTWYGLSGTDQTVVSGSSFEGLRDAMTEVS